MRAVVDAGGAGGVDGEERVKGSDVEELLGEVERRVAEVRRFIVEHGKGELISVCFLRLVDDLVEKTRLTNMRATDPDDIYDLPKFD